MQIKPSVLLLKGRNTSDMSDICKMAVHLENVLLEMDGVDFKTRQGLTDSAIKSSDFVIFCGFDSYILSEFFRVLHIIENLPEEVNGPIVFLYEEPGKSIYEHLNYILTSGMDEKRISSRVFKNIVDTWRYRDIVDSIAIAVRRLGSLPDSKPSAAINPGTPGESAGARQVEGAGNVRSRAKTGGAENLGEKAGK